ncbi:MAG: 2-dehydropantoate 2-reductase [Ignavibacteriae bacterium]|nr:MAG: 2-dehydropantoate 2-reductase [Ignavibacteriota bacterium]
MENEINKNGTPLPKIGIIGLGPVGMILAVHLKEAGCDLAICDNDKIKINLIRKEGIRLEESINKHCFFDKVYTSIQELKDFMPDILVFSLKTHQMSAVLSEAAKLKHDNLCVVSAQNGIDSEKMLSRVFGESRTLRFVVNYAGNLNAPNIVKVTFFIPPNYIASMDDSHANEAKYIAGQLNSINLTTEAVNSYDILKRIWEKTILNSALSAICGIGKLTMKEAMDIPDTEEIVEMLIQEAVEVAEAEKIKFEDDFIRKCMRYLRRGGNHFPSLAVDLINNKETEIDYFNGAIVEYGRKHYIRTSLNLAFTNMVKAMTHKNIISQFSGTGLNPPEKKSKHHQIHLHHDRKAAPIKGENHFLGIDLGSAYIKFTVIDSNDEIVFNSTLKTLNRDKIALRHVLEAIRSEYPVSYTCSTGYGRKHFHDSEVIKTEINCAAAAVSYYYPGPKNIIDIGGEDIKIIRCDDFNNVENFYLNDKCAAGTGSFISEIAERADIKVSEMSDLASKSTFAKELNSFCTVFAKTEIMSWLFDGISVGDISKGIYISLANKVSRLRVDTNVPSYMIGGVIEFHPYLKTLLEEKFLSEVSILEKPQHVVSFGAALIAKQSYLKQLQKEELIKSKLI